MNSGRKHSARIALLEKRRLQAAQMFADGARTIDVARKMAVTWRTAFKWRQALAARGIDGLRSRGLPGREPLLDARQRRRLRTIVRAGARKSGFDDDAWTLARVHLIVQRVFGITCSKVSVWRMLRQSPSTAGISTRRSRGDQPPAGGTAPGATTPDPASAT